MLNIFFILVLLQPDCDTVESGRLTSSSESDGESSEVRLIYSTVYCRYR